MSLSPRSAGDALTFARELVQQGIAASKSGDKRRARELLTQAVRVDAQNEQAWLWLSDTLTDAVFRRICLEKVLAINPANVVARKGLETLAERPAIPELQEPDPPPAPPPDVDLALSAPIPNLLLDPNQFIPGIGASGAIAGVMGAFLLLYPVRRIRTLIFVLIPLFPRLPAWVLLIYWILQEVVLGEIILVAGYNFTGVGVWAHIGGFFGGLLFIYFFLRQEVLFNRESVLQFVRR